MPVITNALKFGVNLIRNSIGHPDELGSPAFWQVEWDQLYAQMPFPTLHGNTRFEVWHMNHPDLAKAINKPNLLDYDTVKDGCQVAAGLYLGGQKRLQIGVFPDNWQSNQTSPSTITEANRAKAKGVLSHEFGHLYADQCGLFSNRNQISAELTRCFRALRPRQTENEHEDFAEVYRAVCGVDSARGYFSDNKRAVMYPELMTLIRAAFWLSGNLANQSISDLAFTGDYATWSTSGWWLSKTYYRVHAKTYQWERWTGSAWVKN